ncbi:MAG: hypothetical protein ACW976_02605 [Candidatus Ranarchaeia archaeon]|jgi:hypothetical protein
MAKKKKKKPKVKTKVKPTEKTSPRGTVGLKQAADEKGHYCVYCGYFIKKGEYHRH